MNRLLWCVFMFVSLLCTLGSSSLVFCQMVRGDTFQQDTAKLNLCIERARRGQGIGIGSEEELVPYEIDERYVERVRNNHPDVTFFATKNGLFECESGNGLYSPVSSSGENWFWHIIRPPSFLPGINTPQGARTAAEACLKDVPQKIDLPNFDHAGYYGARDMGYRSANSLPDKLTPPIAGIQVESFDVEVNGIAYFKTPTIGLMTLEFTCLYSPMLRLKAVGWRKSAPGPQNGLYRLGKRRGSDIDRK